MKSMMCTQCGFQGKPKKYTKGTFPVEVVLWLLLIVPGIIYSVYRHTSRYEGCPKCRGKMIPTDSPFAQKMMK